jgi:hypothetical protein
MSGNKFNCFDGHRRIGSLVFFCEKKNWRIAGSDVISRRYNRFAQGLRDSDLLVNFSWAAIADGY